MKFFTETQFLFALHRVKLSVLTPDCKMESNSKASDIICTDKRSRQDNIQSDSDLEEIVFPLRNRRRIVSNDEEEVQNENGKRTSAGNVPDRLQAKQWAHFPRNIPPTNSKKNPRRRCVVCAKHKKQSETMWECKKCLVALHIASCFEKYHTLQDY
jgi:ribosomal protein L37AE/L43A